MMLKMTATAQRPGDETERQFGWQDMFVGRTPTRGGSVAFVSITVTSAPCSPGTCTTTGSPWSSSAQASMPMPWPAVRSSRPTSRCSAWCVTSRTPNGTGSAR